MCHGCDPEVARSEPNASPDQAVPEGDPVEMVERIDQEWIERKSERAGEKGKRREPRRRIGFSPA